MEAEGTKNFIEQIIDNDIKEGFKEKIHTRFPPEPNGYLHIGHAKSILLNYGIAQKYNGIFNLRFDDTNPVKEDQKYINSILEDVNWLIGYDGKPDYASDYFQKMYEAAVVLINKGKAYVCDLTPEEIREYRGTLTEPGKNSPYRDRSIEENLELFERMRKGDFANGEKVLRAKIDMSSPNINMRDPVLYRVAHIPHHRTKSDWCIYPMYDFAHPLEDAFEGITHSLCTLEFEDHRAVYDWVVNEVGFKLKPHQYEFAKLKLKNTVVGKRYIKRLVDNGDVTGWDDPRLATLSALRRRGYTPESIKRFVSLTGVTKAEGEVEPAMLEYCIREDLKPKADRVMAVLDPVKLIITNYPEGQTENFSVSLNVENEDAGEREVPFSKEIYIEREDFMENPPKKYFRLFQGNEVRLMNAYFVTCTSFEKDENGNVTVVYCTYDPDTRGGDCKDRKVKGTIHWVNADTAFDAKVRIFDNIIDEEKGVFSDDGEINVNPDSLKEMNAKLEPFLKDAKKQDRFQFVRSGYYVVDLKDSKEGEPVFNRIVSLKSSFKL